MQDKDIVTTEGWNLYGSYRNKQLNVGSRRQ